MDITPERLFEVYDALADVNMAFGNLHLMEQKDERDRAQARVMLTIAGLCVLELAKHLAAGMDLEEALLATVRGEMKLTNEQSREWNDAMRRFRDPTQHK